MQANDITTERLRHLAGIRARSGKVVSLFVNLDPREFATPPARATEVRSIVDRAWRQARDDESLTGSERAALRADLDRVRRPRPGGVRLGVRRPVRAAPALAARRPPAGDRRHAVHRAALGDRRA